MKLTTFLKTSLRLMALLMLLTSRPAEAQDATCAKVKLQLKQEITLTRTAFEATLQLSNGPGNFILTDIKVTLEIRDGLQIVATDKFAIPTPGVSGFVGVNGDGTLNAGQSGTATWKILPTRDAAPFVTTNYFVGGSISYKQDGSPVTIPLYPAKIIVQPDPLMTFYYFLQYNVYSDDPFTPEIEPTEPFTLGLIIANKGYGTARNLRISTSQPQIIDNEKGLLIDFKLIGSQVNTLPASPSFLVNMGDIAPTKTSVARWLMTSSLLGRFIDFSAKFEHRDGLGNPRVSLIDGLETHFMDHCVRLEGVDEDYRPDFLTYSATNPAPDAFPDQVYDSNDAVVTSVVPLTNAVVDAPVNIGHLRATLTLPIVPTGYAYLRIPDPSLGVFQIVHVIRGDGIEVTLDNSDHWGNVWTTDRVIRGPGKPPVREFRLHIFDKNPTRIYTLVYGQKAPVATSAGGTKQYADGINVSFTGVVTARFSDGMYVEALDRSGGIKVTPGSVNEGTAVSILGAMHTDPNGERTLAATTVASSGQATLEPFAVAPHALYSGDFFYNPDTGAGQRGMRDGYGLNAVGSLLRTLGRVQSLTSDGFLMADAYGRSIKVLLPSGGTPPAVASFVGLTGIVTCEQVSGQLYPVLRLRRAADLLYDAAQTLRMTLSIPPGTLALGTNLMALAGIPETPAPASVLRNFDPAGDGTGLSGRLNRYNVLNQSEVLYTLTNPALFGEMTVGEGYNFRVDAGDNRAVQFSGFRADFADWRQNLTKEGATRIGSPLLYPFDFEDLLVSDGIKTISIREAMKTEFPVWLNGVQFYDTTTGTLRSLGFPEDNPASAVVKPWTGYWAYAGSRQLALIFPTQTKATTPTLTSMTPQTSTAGGSAFTLTLTGTRFTGASLVLWNGQPRATTFVSPTRLTALIPASDTLTSGSAEIRVSNPALGGGVSNALIITFGLPQISLTGIGSITRTATGIVVIAEISNTGLGTASTIQFGKAKLGTANVQTLPGSISSLTAGTKTTVQLVFPLSSGTTGASVFLRLTGTFTGGNFTTNRRVTLP